MDETLPPHVAAAMCAPCDQKTSTLGWVVTGLLIVGVAAWTFWPVPTLTPQELAALTAANVTCVPPGNTVCPASQVPLGWPSGAGQVLGLERFLLLSKAGWKFYAPVSAPPSTPATS